MIPARYCVLSHFLTLWMRNNHLFSTRLTPSGYDIPISPRDGYLLYYLGFEQER